MCGDFDFGTSCNERKDRKTMPEHQSRYRLNCIIVTFWIYQHLMSKNPESPFEYGRMTGSYRICSSKLAWPIDHHRFLRKRQAVAIYECLRISQFSIRNFTNVFPRLTPLRSTECTISLLIPRKPPYLISNRTWVYKLISNIQVLMFKVFGSLSAPHPIQEAPRRRSLNGT